MHALSGKNPTPEQRHLQSAFGRLARLAEDAQDARKAITDGRPLAQVSTMLQSAQVNLEEAIKYLAAAQRERAHADDVAEIERVESRDTAMRVEAATDNRWRDAVNDMIGKKGGKR